MNKIIIPLLITIVILVLIVLGIYFLFSYSSDDLENSKKPIVENNNPKDDNIENNNNISKNMTAIMKTNFGEIELELFNNDAPKTVANFVKLSKEGFYNETKFHRVIKGFMIQGGDPLSKDDSMQDRWGTGDPGYKFEDEIHTNNKNVIGTISMANSGPNTNGSQFFINTANNNFLDTKHTVFGKITKGMDIIAKIENTPTEDSDRPISPIIIESIIIN